MQGRRAIARQEAMLLAKGLLLLLAKSAQCGGDGAFPRREDDPDEQVGHLGEGGSGKGGGKGGKEAYNVRGWGGQGVSVRTLFAYRNSNVKSNALPSGPLPQSYSTHASPRLDPGTRVKMAKVE